jgi:hypothetical protein
MNQDIIQFTNPEKDYVFVDRLKERSKQLRRAIAVYNQVIWPVIVREEDFTLVDGYCRFSALKSMNTKRIFVYVGKFMK